MDNNNSSTASESTPPTILAQTASPLDTAAADGLTSALKLAARGFFVFPCEPRGKKPIGGHGHLEATTDVAAIRRWWAEMPTANVAVACAASGLVVLDIDPRHDGDATLTVQEERLGKLPMTVEAATGGVDGGRHLFFRAPGGPLIGKLGDGLDVKHQGYVVAAPSIHPDGGRYRWKASPFDNEVAELPAQWRKRLTKRPRAEARVEQQNRMRTGTAGAYGRSVLESEIEIVRNAREGERNNSLNRAAFALAQLHAGGVVSDVREVLAQAATDAGLPEVEGRATIESGWKAGLAEPRIPHEDRPSSEGSSLVTAQLHTEASTGAAGGEEWPEPEPLPDGLPHVPSFDERLLPEVLRPWLSDVAERTQCPPEYAAVGALVSASSVIGRGCTIRPKHCDPWQVVPNLWGALIGPPASMKTPALTEALAPVQRLVAKATAKYQQETEGLEARIAEAEARRAVAREDMKKAARKGGDMAAAKVAFAEAGELPKTTERRYLVNDSTIEKIGVLLNENPRGLLHYRDELTGWLSTLDRDGHEGDRAFFLEGWNGTGRFTVDRISRGTLHIEALCLSMLGGIQPGPLAEYLRVAMRGGMGADGLMQRFQLLVYPDPPRVWRNVDRWPDSAARNRAFEIFQRLDTLSKESLGATTEEDGLPCLHFDVPAQKLFDEWRADLMNRLLDSEEHPAIESHLAKYGKLMPSLALIFHLCDAGTMPPGAVGLASAQRAVGWCNVLEAHARRVYSTIATAKLGAARTLLAKLRSGAIATPFGARDIYRAAWSGLDDRELVLDALAILTDHGWVREAMVDTAGRTRHEYHVHPALQAGSAQATPPSVLSVPANRNASPDGEG